MAFSLANNGDSLFIVDAASRTNYLYDLAQDPQGTHNLVNVRALSDNEKFIREHVASINRFYNFQQDQILAAGH